MLRVINAGTSAINTVNKFNRDAVEKVVNFGVRIENKAKGTMAENWLKYWKNVFIDYKEVAIDVAKNSKEKPLKAVSILTTVGFLGYCMKHNPNAASFRDAYISNANRILLVHPTSQNSKTVEHLKNIERHYNSCTIRRLSLGVLSVIWVDYFSDACHVYEADCTYLQLQYKKFIDRIIDVGFLDNWWIIENKMIDYDINY